MEATISPVTVNGVNVDALDSTLGVLREKPGLARFVFRAANRWVSGGFNQTSIHGTYGLERELTHAQPFTLDADEPAVLLGTDRGAGPVEHLLHALASCLTTSIAYHAAAHGVAIETMESRLDGDIDLNGFLGLSATTPKGFTAIRAVFRIKSEASPEMLAEWGSFSPVYETVSRSVPVDLRIEKV